MTAFPVKMNIHNGVNTPVAVEKYVQVLRYLMETGCPYDALSVIWQLDDIFDSNTYRGRRHAEKAAKGEFPDSEPNSKSPTTSSRRRKRSAAPPRSVAGLNDHTPDTASTARHILSRRIYDSSHPIAT
jgi:hypothetical protein